jgi:hypothetical protein
MSLNYLIELIDEHGLGYPLLNDVCSVRQAGYSGLGYTLLSESRLLVLRAPISPRIVGQKWHDAWAKTGVVPCVWKEHRLEHRHGLF